jgi:hypothetical protein
LGIINKGRKQILSFLWEKVDYHKEPYKSINRSSGKEGKEVIKERVEERMPASKRTH